MLVATCLRWSLIAGCVLAIAACDTRTNPELRQAAPGAAAPVQAAADGWIAANAEQIELTVQWSDDGGGRTASVYAAGAVELKAAHFKLELEQAEQYAAQVAAADWAGADALSIAVPSGDELHVAVVMMHPQDKPGFSGDTLLARIELRPAAPTKLTAVPPVTPQSRIDLDYDPFSNQFFFYYRSHGDYDQNREVNAADIVPIAVHFGKAEVGGFPETSVESVVDGDGNGEINAADIVPIASGFSSTQSSFNIYQGLPDKYPTHPAEPSVIPPIHSVQFTETDTVPSEGRLYYETQNPQPGSQTDGYWLRPWDDGIEGIPSEIAGLGNQRPEAVVTVPQNFALAPLQVIADASASFDPEGGPLTYHWLVFVEGSQQPYLEQPLGEPTLVLELPAGRYFIVCLVQDDDGARDFAGVVVESVATAGWQINEVLPGAPGDLISTVFDIDLAEVDGQPHIGAAYQFGNSGRISIGNVGLDQSTFDGFLLVHAEGSIIDGEVQVLDAAGEPGVVSLLRRNTIGFVNYHRMVDDMPQSPGGYLADHMDEYKDVSAALVDGRPALSLHNESDGDLLFIHADNAVGSSWGAPVVLEDLGDTGEMSTLAQIDGAPMVLYYSVGGQRVRLIRSTVTGGVVTWDPPFTLTPLPGARLNDSLLELPAAEPWLYINETNAMQASVVSGSLFGNTGVVTATDGSAANLFSAALIEGQVCMVWYDALAQRLKFIRSDDAAGVNWGTPEVITEQPFATTVAPSLAEIGGRAAVVYVDSGTNQTYYAILVED